MSNDGDFARILSSFVAEGICPRLSPGLSSNGLISVSGHLRGVRYSEKEDRAFCEEKPSH